MSNRSGTKTGQVQSKLRLKMGMVEKALDDYTQFTILKPTDADGWAMRANIFARLGKWDRVNENISRAIVLKPKKKANHLNGICWNIVKMGKAKEALDYCENAVAASPKAAGIIDSRAFAYWQLGRFDEARADMEKAHKLNPKFSKPDVRFNEFRVLVIKKLLELADYGLLGEEKPVIDTKTLDAIRKYQKDNGLAVTGEANNALMQHLIANRKEVAAK